MNFVQKLKNIIKKNNSLLCVGIDPDITRFPKHILNASDHIFSFNKAIIDATHDLVCSYKPNFAFYAACGIEGLKQLKQTIDYIKNNYPEIPVILDAKRGDIGLTATYYSKEVFDVYGADAVTVNPYLGFDALEPFLKRKDKGIIILCKTSNPGTSDIQDIKTKNNNPLYIDVAKKVVEWNKISNNCLMVVGATWPEELKKIREITPKMFFLLPGIGPQGGDLEKSMKYGLTKEKSGLIVNIGRAIIYSSTSKDFAKKAREKAIEFKNQINKFRKL